MMKRYFYILFLSLISCSKIEESGSVITTTESIGSEISSIVVMSGFDLEVGGGYVSDREIVIEAYESVIPYVLIEVEDNVLQISIDAKNVDSDLHLIAYVPSDIFKDFTVSGQSQVRLNSVLSEQDVTINLSGGSTFIGDVNSTNVHYTSTGGSTGFLLGSVDLFEIVGCSGGSVIESFGLQSNIVDLTVSGGSRLEINVQEEISGSCSGSSSITYQGSPHTVNVDVTGGSSIECAN